MATRKLDVSNKYDSPADRHISCKIPYRMNTGSQRVEWVPEGKATVVVQYGPVVHLLAGENEATHIAQIKDQQPLFGQLQMIEVYFPVHAIREDNVG